MFLFSTFSFSRQCFWTGWQNFLSVFPSVVAVDTCDQSQMYFVDNLANDRAYFLKFRV